MEPPKNIIRPPAKSIRHVNVAQQPIPVQKPIVVSKQLIGGSEYFIGTQFQHSNKQHSIQFNYSNPKAPDSLEVTP
mgnify:CR=1 FL=1